MALKERLKVAFLIMILIPFIMAVVSIKLIVGYMGASVRETYDVNADTMQVITNPMRILNHVTRETYNQIKLCAIREPGKLEDMDYITKLNEELQGKYSYLVVRKNDEIIYFGGTADEERIKRSLPEFGNYNTDMDGGLYVGENNPVLIKHQDFYFTDGSEGSVYIIT